MVIRKDGIVRVVSTEDSPSNIEVFPGNDGTFVVEQIAGISGIHQTSFTKQEMMEFGAFLINLANGT